MTAQPFRRALCLAGAAVLTGLSGIVGGAPAAAAATDAMIRGGHFSPDTPGVDVYLSAFEGGTRKVWLSGVGYGDVSPYQRFTPGVYAVSMRPHGADPSTPAALTWTLNARAGASYTACAVGMNADLRGVVLSDDLSVPPAGTSRLRVVQAASVAKQARVAVQGGATLGTAIKFATTTPYTAVPAGRHVITAAAAGEPSVRTSAAVTLAPATVHTLVLLDTKGGGISVRTLNDAAGAGTPPRGAAPAGAGGTAESGDQAWPGGLLLALLVAALLGLGAATVAGRDGDPRR